MSFRQNGQGLWILSDEGQHKNQHSAVSYGIAIRIMTNILKMGDEGMSV